MELKVLRKKTKMEERMERLRLELFGDVSAEVYNRRQDDGWTTIPRTLPLIMTLVTLLSKKKNNPSQLYLELWCRAFDPALIDVKDEEGIAYASGYTTPRNIRSLHERLDLLEELGFIRIGSAGTRRYRYILLIHPHQVVAKLNAEGRVPKEWYVAYVARMNEIGAELPVHKERRKSTGV